ncbi:ATP-grasp domain-containing protein [Saccharothrix xinjiangensis]|uniref:ATP-grasp domain-containing protein n=1 Tax=Saccharothrix xinjiangensis TaxID=204798 RepID=A0ABV9YEB7_9PSEU
MTGRGYKDACRRRGLPYTSLYTLPVDLLTSYDQDYALGDTSWFHVADVSSARAALRGPVLAVVPTTEPSIVLADGLGTALGLPSNPVSTALARRDKTVMRRHAVTRGVRVPAFAVVSRVDIPAAADALGYPAIAKPAKGAGAHGVTVLRGAGEVPDLVTDDLFGHPMREWIVEEYVRGRELAVNAFTEHGRHRVLDIWEYRQPNGDDYDQPYWDVVQLPEDDPDRERAVEFVHAVLDAYDVRLGPSHTEIKVDDRGPCLIELGTRLPGAHIVDQWTAHSSIRPYDDTLSVYLGASTGLLTRDLGFDAALGICCLRNDDRPGELVSTTWLEDVRSVDGVDAVFTDLRPGDHVPVTADLGSVVAFALVSAPDHNLLDRVLVEVRSAAALELK